jgi:hypothetical protein
MEEKGIFLSDLASANGKFLDPSRGLQGVDYSQSTTYNFPSEHSSDADWALWSNSGSNTAGLTALYQLLLANGYTSLIVLAGSGFIAQRTTS